MGAADAETDLEPALRERIDRIAAQLDTIDHYALLGLPRNADRKLIKTAYFAQAAVLHPDRHFGKRLGPWKQRMEVIFGRLSIAHETLTNPSARAEYDAYLAERDRSSASEESFEVDESSLEIAEERPINANAIRSSDRLKAVAQPIANAPSPEEERARREALARKLAGGTHRRMTAVRPPSAPKMPAASTPAPPQAGVESLVAAARNALALGDLTGASTKMRLAAKIDARYTAEADSLAKRVYASMAESHAKQAEHEESQERWVGAALSWAKAFEGKPDDGSYAERGANALRRAGGDLHKAAQLGEAAVRLRPNDPRARATLASVYLDAGLIRRAKTEIDHALRLAPNDPQIRDVAKQIATRS